MAVVTIEVHTIGEQTPPEGEDLLIFRTGTLRWETAKFSEDLWVTDTHSCFTGIRDLWCLPPVVPSKQLIHDDVPPLDNQPSNGFPSPYPTPFTYEQKQPKLGERALLFDDDDNEWLCAQLIRVNDKTVWQIEDFRYWKVEPESNHRWLPFPPAP